MNMKLSQIYCIVCYEPKKLIALKELLWNIYTDRRPITYICIHMNSAVGKSLGCSQMDTSPKFVTEQGFDIEAERARTKTFMTFCVNKPSTSTVFF